MGSNSHKSIVEESPNVLRRHSCRRSQKALPPSSAPTVWVRQSQPLLEQTSPPLGRASSNTANKLGCPHSKSSPPGCEASKQTVHCRRRGLLQVALLQRAVDAKHAVQMESPSLSHEGMMATPTLLVPALTEEAPAEHILSHRHSGYRACMVGDGFWIGTVRQVMTAHFLSDTLAAGHANCHSPHPSRLRVDHCMGPLVNDAPPIRDLLTNPSVVGAGFAACLPLSNTSSINCGFTFVHWVNNSLSALVASSSGGAGPESSCPCCNWDELAVSLAGPAGGRIDAVGLYGMVAISL